MKKKLWLLALVVAPLATAAAWQQEKKAAQASSPADDPMMAKIMQYGTPGEAHKALAPKVGKWTVEMKQFQPGGTVATTMTGSSEARWIFDGRFVEEDFRAEYMGEPFQGRGTTGYDIMKKQYVSTWIDSMSTAIFSSSGTFDPATKTFSFSGEAPDVMAEKYVKMRWVEKWIDADHSISQGFKPGPDGKEFMEMEMHYTRAK
jgi:hypothetical protein